MNRPKIAIYKKIVLSSEGHYRYYSPYFDINSLKLKKKDRVKHQSAMFDLGYENNPNYPNISYITTEKQLCRFIYENFGPGEYRITGYVKGREGCWTFWRGEITDLGFSFERKNLSNTKEIAKLQKEIGEEEDESMKEILQEMIDDEKQTNKENPTRYGFLPYLKPSSRRGEMVYWSDDEISIENDNLPKEDDWEQKPEAKDDDKVKDVYRKMEKVGEEVWG